MSFTIKQTYIPPEEPLEEDEEDDYDYYYDPSNPLDTGSTILPKKKTVAKTSKPSPAAPAPSGGGFIMHVTPESIVDRY